MFQHRIAITRNEFTAIAVCCGLLIVGDVANIVLEDRNPFEDEYAKDDSVFFALSKAELSTTRIESVPDTTTSDSTQSKDPVLADSSNLSEDEGLISSASQPGRIDLNTASAQTLTRLPGIGPALAARIVESRTRFGPFKSVREITRVSGIGKAKLARIEERAFVSGS